MILPLIIYNTYSLYYNVIRMSEKSENEKKRKVKKMKVFYNDNPESFLIHYGRVGFYEEDLVELPIDVGYDEEKTKNENFERVFSMLNRPTNPLASEENQEWLRENMKRPHTSMSCGDAIKFDGTIWVVDDIGFTKMEEVKEKQESVFWDKTVNTRVEVKLDEVKRNGVKIGTYEREDETEETIAFSREVESLIEFVKQYREVSSYEKSDEHTISLGKKDKKDRIWFGGSKTSDFLNKEKIDNKEYWV